MADETGHVLIYTTFPSAEAAEGIGRRLVTERLAACVNILPGMTAIYIWDGTLERGQEAVMIVKTRAALADTVIQTVRQAHSYTNPALLVLPVAGGSADFLGWIEKQTLPQPPAPSG